MRLTDERIITHLALGGWITLDDEVFFYLDELGQFMKFIPRIEFTGLADFAIDEVDNENWKVLGDERTL